MMSSGSGYGPNYAQFSSGHAPHGIMLRQKSVGELLSQSLIY